PRSSSPSPKSSPCTGCRLSPPSSPSPVTSASVSSVALSTASSVSLLSGNLSPSATFESNEKQIIDSGLQTQTTCFSGDLLYCRPAISLLSSLFPSSLFNFSADEPSRPSHRDRSSNPTPSIDPLSSETVKKLKNGKLGRQAFNPVLATEANKLAIQLAHSRSRSRSNTGAPSHLHLWLRVPSPSSEFTDETMHSGADVEAFTAALNRDIEGDNTSISQPPTGTDAGSDGKNALESSKETRCKWPPWERASLSQGTNHTPSQLFQQWQSSSREGNASYSSQEEVKAQIQEQQSSAMEVNRQGSGSESQHLPNDTPREMNHIPSEPSRPQDDLAQQQADQHNVHMSQTTNIQNADKNHGHRQEPNIARNPDNESQLQRMHRMGNQQAMATGQAANTMNRPSGKQVPFALLLPVIEPQLDKDRAMQLQGLYVRLRNNNINKEEFVRHMRSLVGDHMLKMAVYKLQQGQALKMENASNQISNPAQLSAKHNIQKPSSYVPPSSAHQSSDSSSLPMDSNAQKSRLLEHQSDSHGIQASHMSSNINAIKQDREQPFPLQGLGKQQQQQQQHMHFPQSSFPTYGNTGGNYHPGSSANMNMSSQSFKQQSHDLQMRQGPVHPSMGASQAMSLPERQNAFSDIKRMHGGGLTHFTSNSGHWQPSMHKDQSLLSSMAYVKPEPVDQMNDQQHKSQLSAQQGTSSFSPGQHEQGSAISGPSKDETFEMLSSRPNFSTSMSKPEAMSITAQLERQNVLSSLIQLQSAANSSLASGSNAKTPPKKPSVGQKKPLEAPVSSLSKKQKVSGAFSDQSIEQLNDVTAVSGVNLREEEEQLFSGSKEDTRVSEASRKVVQEEEERLILQKTPLQKKLAEIMAKCGIKNRSNDVERCLSLCVEERMRGLISNLIRLSKQRVDIEKPRHRTVITSDVRQQIMSMNQKARDEWEKKQADAEKLQRADEASPEGSAGIDGDDGRGKNSKVNKEEDDKMRTTAANVAARAAVGGDDMLSKWQLMAEQARQKREGGADAASTSQPSIDVGPKPVSTSERNFKDNPDMERSSSAVTSTPGFYIAPNRNDGSHPLEIALGGFTPTDEERELFRATHKGKSPSDPKNLQKQRDYQEHKIEEMGEILRVVEGKKTLFSDLIIGEGTRLKIVETMFDEAFRKFKWVPYGVKRIRCSNHGGPAARMKKSDFGESDAITIARSISVKDVISVLGREIQMSRSTLIYRLYERLRSDSE
ncbi:Histone-fold, partial [Cynara cardunculus var. scolymus]